MAKLVTLTIDEQKITVPEGTLVVDAAKKIGIDIPVFCYHPKMEPVGMCRMCLVEIGRPMIDRATNSPVLEADGSPKIQYAPKLETACTTPVSEGMVVIGMNEKVKAARKEVLELLLTSHPLDCPICDKGGECPLQNLTLAHGSGQSRFIYGEKMHSAKHVPLGELIFLDRERCIQCARCVRFQKDLADDPVIGFYNRGRRLEIVTYSEPGFDSYFSGNTSDICPVGALTTADFRFGARPWEMKSSASICTHCPVGCNLSFNVRREAHSQGKSVIKRVMPRQNEAVNEIWICDKGRFAYHFAESAARLTEPLVRKDGELVPVAWSEALDLIAAQMRQASENGLVTLVGGRLPNEDLFNLHQLTTAQKGQPLLYSYMEGGDLVAQVGVGQGTNLGDLGKGSAILVVASDLHEEAPIWWLRVKEAAKRGAQLIVLNPRATRLDAFATHAVRYAYGEEIAALSAFLPGSTVGSDAAREAARIFAEAENGIIFFGSEGLGLAETRGVARMCAQILTQTRHVGRANNGLIGVWPNANTQGAWEVGFRPAQDLAARLAQAQVVYIAGADPAGDSPALAGALQSAGLVVVQELFMTETASLADVVLPVLAYTEREGTFTSGERRVQHFYQAVSPAAGLHADYWIAAQVAERLGLTLESRTPSLIMLRMAQALSDFTGLTYPAISQVTDQWPIVGRHDLYYGGTTYDNAQGLGVQLAPLVTKGEARLPEAPTAARSVLPEAGSLRIVPVTRLYDRGQMLMSASLLYQRLAKTALWMHADTAADLGLKAGESAVFELDGRSYELPVQLNDELPRGTAHVARSTGVPVDAPVTVQLKSRG